jgi:hypothetical protein
MDGPSYVSGIKYGFKSSLRNWTRQIDQKYGKIIESPLLLFRYTKRNKLYSVVILNNKIKEWLQFQIGWSISSYMIILSTINKKSIFIYKLLYDNTIFKIVIELFSIFSSRYNIFYAMLLCHNL